MFLFFMLCFRFFNFSCYISDSTRKRRHSSSTCSSHDTPVDRVIDLSTGSPPCKRSSTAVLSRAEAGNDISPDCLDLDPSRSLEDLIRGVYDQYHDNLRVLKRDVHSMVLHYTRLRDERISFYARNFSRSSSLPRTDVQASVISDLTQDIDLDMSNYGSISVQRK